MLSLKNVNKYFNRHKKNEIHVINNISLDFSDSGMVALLGPSGCGKTTLLNAIGGMDSIKSGKIYVNGKKISSKLNYKVDKIRNLNIGYIFQDYKLVDNLSVFDNVKLVLTMLGIKDKNEIKSRVEYVLDCVGMLRYKRRPASMLSGGERQRVGIARALVKNPNIILADEPTGNLDSKNSLEIMKIIKSISKDRLVILVTHEVNLAKFYADRIIELKDGTVVRDYINSDKEDLDYTIDNNIYLKDFDKHDVIKDDDKNINIYLDNKDKIKLDIVVKNGNIYVNSKDNIVVIDEDSNIELINDSYKKIQESDIDKYKFNIGESKHKLRYSSIFNPISLIVNGFKKVFDYSFLKKLLLIGFLLSGIFIMYSVSSISALYNIKDEKFVTINKNYLSVNLNKIKVDDYLGYENIDSVSYVLPGNSIVSFRVNYKDYYQTYNSFDTLNGSLTDINLISNSDLIYGNMPVNNNEVVVDKRCILSMFNENGYAQMIGIKDVSDMIGRIINIDNLNDFVIVGIVDLGSPSIYAYKDNFINILANSKKDNDGIMRSDAEYEDIKLYDYNLKSNEIELKKGRMPTNDYEVIVNVSNSDSMPLNKYIDNKVNDKKLLVVGYYFSKDSLDCLLVNSNTVKYDLITKSKDMVVMSNDKDKTISEFRDKGLNIEDSYSVSRKKYIDSNKDRVNTTMLVSLVILIISLVEVFLMIRASFLSRVKSVGIYRAIGVKKRDIYRMFYGEIIAITTISSVPGIIFAAYVLNILSKIKYIGEYFLINFNVVLISILFVYVFNLVIGLIPVFNTIRRKPASILSRYDLE
mgnify:CR=1 FL=1